MNRARFEADSARALRLYQPGPNNNEAFEAGWKEAVTWLLDQLEESYDYWFENELAAERDAGYENGYERGYVEGRESSDQDLKYIEDAAYDKGYEDALRDSESAEKR
jgi:flagellar biosynthesis/type III secretory pathway protein FliH